MIERAAAIEGAEGRLETAAAAIARRPQRRPYHLGTQRRRQNPGADGGGRSAARAAGGARGIMRIAHRHERLGGGELGRRRLAENDGAGLAQRLHRRRIATRLETLPDRRALPGRHVLGFDDVLDADGHAVDRRERLVAAPTPVRGCRRRDRGRARNVHESLDRRIDLVETRQSGLQLRRRRGLTRREPRGERRVRWRRAAFERPMPMLRRPCRQRDPCGDAP